MKSYKSQIQEIHKSHARALGAAVASRLYETNRIVLDDLDIAIDGSAVCNYKNNVIKLNVDIVLDMGTVTEVYVIMDEFSIMQMTSTTNIQNVYSNFIHSCYMLELIETLPSIEIMKSVILKGSSHPLDEKIQGIVKVANDHKGGINSWYKMSHVTPDVKCKNSFVLVKPKMNHNYTAWVLPMSWWAKLECPSVVPTKLKPELVDAWYKVESGQEHSMFDITDMREPERLKGIFSKPATNALGNLG